MTTGASSPVIRPIYIGKNQNPKNLGFLLYRLHCQKTHNFLVFGQEKRMVRMRDFRLPLTVRSAQYVVGRGWFRGRSRPTWPKTRIIPVSGEQAFTLAKKPVKNWRSFKKPHFGGGFFDSGFLQCLGVVA